LLGITSSSGGLYLHEVKGGRRQAGFMIKVRVELRVKVRVDSGSE